MNEGPKSHEAARGEVNIELGEKRHRQPNREVVRSSSEVEQQVGEGPESASRCRVWLGWVVLKLELTFRDERWWKFGWKLM